MSRAALIVLQVAIGFTIVGAATGANPQTTGDENMTTDEIFKKAQETYAGLSSYIDTGKSVAVISGMTITHTFSIKLGRPNLYRIEWEDESKPALMTTKDEKQVVWSQGKGDFLESSGRSEKCASKEMALAGATGISGGASATIPGTFFRMSWGNELGLPASRQTRQADEKLGKVDCYVFTSDIAGNTKTIWMGKQDFLIRQVRTVTNAAQMKAVMDEEAKRRPEIAARMPKIEPSDIISTETHENIVLNQKISLSDFGH